MTRGRILGGLLALCMMLTAPAFGEQIPAPSPLGIDYMALTQGDAQLAGILLAGEAEWVQSGAKDEFGSDLAIEFEDNVRLLKKEKVTEGMLRDLIAYTPKMLLSFKELPKERYPLLHEIGRGMVIDELGKTMKQLGE